MAKRSTDSRRKYKGVEIRKTTRVAIYLRDDFKCSYCGRNLKSAKPFEITLDHLRCKSNGGSNVPTNLVTACRSCNCERQNTGWRKFAEVKSSAAIKRVQRNTRRKLNRELAREIVNG